VAERKVNVSACKAKTDRGTEVDRLHGRKCTAYDMKKIKLKCARCREEWPMSCVEE
jgi:hypothetical protein